MQHIDENCLETDLEYRFNYLADFMGFGEEDIGAIHGAAEVLGPIVPQLVDAIYEKLFTYDATKRHFVPRQPGDEGPVPENIDALEQDHELIEFRKQHLGRYLVRLVSKPYDGKMATYLDMVGKMHTPKAGSKQLDVPLVQMNAMMGFLADALLAAIAGMGLDRDVEVRTQRAFNKLLWLRNDLINRHYAASPEKASA